SFVNIIGRAVVLVLGAVLLACILGSPLDAAFADAQPVELAAPYEYLGWGSPQPPAGVLAATGVKDLTLAFMLSHGKCNPAWDGKRPLLGGADQSAIEAVRAAGGDVDVSFGGWSGKKLGSACKTPQALAAAYQKVIDAYSLHAIDIDIEHGEFTNKKTRLRVVAALAAVQRANAGLEISITFGTGEAGPERDGQSLIADAAAIGFQPSVWTIMPFDFGAPVADMGQTSIKAAEGLEHELASRYGLTTALAYEHVGISSMNGTTDESDETVSAANFEAMLTFAQQHNLGRLTFWSVNRDRPCAAKSSESDSCSGIEQQAYEFSDLLAQYHG
ncbi:MAG TPA: chitinase, partial [Solirubrobacteraceae bacterium]